VFLYYEEKDKIGGVMSIRQNKQGLRVLTAGSILQLLLGIIYVWSVFVAPVSTEYAWETSGVMLTSSFMLSFFVVGILVGGKLLLRHGTQKVVLIGGLAMSVGMFTTAFLPSGDWARLMYLSYGIIGGFGVGMGYNAVISASQKWFPQNRGFATGVSACAFGFSTVIFAPLVGGLVAQFGIRSTFIILSATALIITLLLFRFIRLPDAGNPSPASAALLAKRQYTTSEALRTREFYFIMFSLMCGTAVFFVLNPRFMDYSEQRGLAEFGTLVVMMTGVANALGRLGTPLLSDKIGREWATVLILSITALCSILMLFAQGFLFVVAVMAIAYCFGSLPGIYPVLTADYFGIKNVGSNYGAVMIGFAISALTFPMIIGLIASETAMFIVLAGLSAVGVALVLLLLKKAKEEDHGTKTANGQ